MTISEPNPSALSPRSALPARRRCRLRMARLLALPCVLALLAAPAAFGKTLKIATVSPDGSPWMTVLRAAASDIDAATEGRVKLKFYPGGVQGDDKRVLSRIRIGQLHGGIILTSAFGAIYPDIQAYNLPMAFRSLGEVDAVRAAMDDTLLAGVRAHGFEAFGIAEVGMAYPMSTRPARTVADARKLKVWTPRGDEPSRRLLEAFEIAPVPLTISEVLAGLSTGLIDAVASPPVAALPLLWHTRLKYVLDLPLLYVYGLFTVSSRSLDGIGDADLDALRRILGAAIAEVNRRNRADHDAARQALAAQGLEFIVPTDAERAEWQRYGALAAERWQDKGFISDGIRAQMQDILATLRAAP